MTILNFGKQLLCSMAVTALGISVTHAVGPDLSYWQRNLGGDSTNQVMIIEDPEIAVVGNVVHILRVETAQTNYNVRRLVYLRSMDNGEHFEPPIVLEEHGGIELGTGRSLRMAVDGNTIHVVSPRSPVGGGDWYYELDYYRSVNGGASFEERRALATGERAWHIKMPHITAKSGVVTIGYLLYPNWYVDSRVNLLVSTDGGATFTGKTAFRTSAEYFDLWDVYRDGDKLAVAVLGSAGIPGSYAYTYRILVGTSVDGGTTWALNQVCSTNSTGWPKADSMSDLHEKTDLAWVGNHVYVTWTGQETNDTRCTFVARSVDNGVTWEPQVNLSAGQTGAPQFGQATLAAKGNYVYVVWNVPNSGIWFRRSADAGASWSDAQYLFGGWWPLVAIDPASQDGATVHFQASGQHRYSEDGGRNLSLPYVLRTAWNWWGSGLRSSQWAFGANESIHLTYFGSHYPMVGSDYDLFYRRYDRKAPTLAANNRCLVLPASHEELHYESLQVSSLRGLRFGKSMTVEMWVRPDAGSPNNSTLLFQENADDYRGTLRLQTHNWANGRRPSGKVLTTNGIVEVWGGELLKDGEWRHLAMTYDADTESNNLRIYVDGKFSAAATGRGPIAQQERTLYIGGAGGSVYETFRGAVDEVRFWNRALSETELRVHTTSRLRTDEPGLVAYYPLDGSTKEITGQALDGVLMYKESFEPFTLAPTPVIRSAPLTSGVVGQPLLYEVVADWPTGFAITAGTVPPGMTFDPALGVLSGTPTVPGVYELVAEARNAYGVDSQALRVVIKDAAGLAFRDDFNVTTNTAWEVIRDANTSQYYSSYPGGLAVRGHWGDLWAGANNVANVFTMPAPASDFMVTLGVSKFAPGENLWTQVFLMAYDDDNNYHRLGYGWSGRRALATIREVASSPAGTDEPLDFGDRPFQLRLSKQGKVYQSYWSTNGVDFHPSGSPMTFGDGTPAKLGFWVGIDPTQTNMAYIDSFEVRTGSYPFITSTVIAGGQTAAPFAWQFTGPSDSLFTATGLPNGLQLHAQTGLISGIPTQSGVFDTVITVSNHNGTVSQNLRLAVDDADRSFFRDDFNGEPATGWDPLPTATSYYHFTNGCQLWLRANNGDTWAHYNRALNLFTVPAPAASFWMATIGVSRYEPSARDYNSLHLVAWNDTDNNVRFTYSYGGGTRNVGITSENAQVMDSYGKALDIGPGPFQLRLVKEGKRYTGLVSTNGVDFVPVVTNRVQLANAPAKVGFWMGIDPGESNEATLDYFDIHTFGPKIVATTEGGSLRVGCQTVVGVTYQVETSSNLSSWSNLGDPIAGTGNTETIGVPAGGGTSFFRISAQ